ncbi:LytTR family DNA-binding domain-containing protein [Geothrix sp. PMB-07]|uniref:LytR/AlgR family response regulator transcription factor n=1 Tax=Geothrix sp. PMB-07 TaxID=3068640 RepID=UPI0027403808|nr:LytTR family DNA-binding domain-containing protein [Geothrix sp. PMB-07]WLT33080.1 LytTR family DNA-binding domain-containing protein [Geothrix sp. PMB-07]
MAEPFRVLVVDDEAPARSKLKRMLASDARFTWIGEAADGLDAVAKTRSLKPDLLILDIQMPGLTGFEVLEALPTPLPQIIFSTAYDQYALNAFEASAVDYLLKPYDGERLARALDRAASLLGARKPDELKGLLSRVAHLPLERLLVEGERGLEALPLKAILRLEAEGKLVLVHTEKGVFEVRRALRDLEARLPPHRFTRVHRSTLVALEAVQRLEPWDHGDGLLVLRGGSHCVLSRTYRAAFLERWGGGA